MIAETFFQLLRDPNHWGMELVVELVSGGLVGALLWPWAQRRWHKRHDTEVHDLEPYVTIQDLANVEDQEDRLSVLEAKVESLRKQWYRAQVDHSRRHEYERPQTARPRRW
jgi:hypothetical protein